MIFKRRAPQTVAARLMGVIAPRKGWRRGFRYIGRRVQRLPDTPHRIALGFACGVYASFTPFFTLHIVVAVALGFILRANLIAAALGTLFGNPLTFPFIAGSSLTVGGWIVGKDRLADRFDVTRVFSNLQGFLDTLFLPYLVGGIAPGLITAGVLYWLLRPGVAAYQARRRAQLMAKTDRRVAEHLSGRPLKGLSAADVDG
ncbi:MAG: DUF2062 domain-containing protein [Rhodobacteraceae bacterium]|nr:MAG: DUF2062 domain-containing protein [Paracoccaceae bacterium]